MKKAWIGIVLLAALLLSACGQNAAPATPAPTTAAATEAATVPTTAETTEPPCEHQWSEATYFTPAVCELCGEEGEKKPSFFEEHGLNIEDYPSPLGYGEETMMDAESTMYNKSGSVIEPDTYKIQMKQWLTYPDRLPQENASYPNVREGIQEVRLNLGVDYHAKICADKTILDQFGFNYGFYDYYTGAWLHPAYLAKNGEDILIYELEIDGTIYTIECTNRFNHGTGQRTNQEDGSILIDAWLSDEFCYSVPMEYDGLVFGILPRRDTRGANVTEDGNFVTNLSEEADFEEGVYFRLNLIDRWVADAMNQD